MLRHALTVAVPARSPVALETLDLMTLESRVEFITNSQETWITLINPHIYQLNIYCALLL